MSAAPSYPVRVEGTLIVRAGRRETRPRYDGIVIPAGEAWLRVLGEDKRARLYSDTLHPSSLGGDLAVLTIYLTLFPAGQYEFTEEFVARAAKALEMPADKRDLFFDAVTRAIDEPMVVK